MQGFVYKITNKVNGMSYIGQTRKSVEFRWRQHKNSKDCYDLHKAIRQYGEDNFDVETLIECAVEDMDKWEMYYIAKYNTFKRGYNMTVGGYSYSPTKRYNNGYIIVDTKYDEIVRLHQAGFSATKIASLYEVDRHVVCAILKQLGFKISNNKIRINNEELKELVAKYESGFSLRQLAKEYGCSTDGLKGFLIRKGADIRKKYSILEDVEAQKQLVEYYTNRTYKVAEIKEMFHCSTQIFRRILNKYGAKPIGKGLTYKLSDKDALEVIKLVNDKVKIIDIANKFKVDKCTIYSLLKRYHIDY